MLSCQSWTHAIVIDIVKPIYKATGIGVSVSAETLDVSDSDRMTSDRMWTLWCEILHVMIEPGTT